MKHSKPPLLFLRFFRWYCHPQMCNYIEGDLMEVYERRLAKSGKRNANFRFIVDVLLLCRPGIIRPLFQPTQINHFTMLTNYFKIGYRNIFKNKGYSFINISGLAIGMAVALLIGLWVYDELTFDQQNPNYDRVAQVIQHVSNNGEKSTWWNQPLPLAEELRTHYGEDFKHIALAAEWTEHMINRNDKVWKEQGAYFEKDGPAILGLRMKLGTSDMKDPASVLLSASAARSYFDDADPINQLIQIDNLPPVKVIGVYENIPDNSRFAGLNFIASWDFYYNNQEWVRTMQDPWRPNFTHLFVELNDHADFASASERIKDAKLKKLNEHLAKKKPELFLHPMKDWHLRSEFKNGVNTGGAIQYVWVFGTVGAFVLLLACINFMNLSTARSERRAKEVGVRKTVGSVKSQLVLQFFSESFVTVVFAFVLSVAFTQSSLPLFNSVAGKHLSLPWSNLYFWTSCIGFIAFTSLIAGSYPAFYLSSFKAIKVLKGTFRSGRFAAMPRKILVTLQFTVSITLIIGTAIIYQQIKFAQGRPVGYSLEKLVSIPTRNAAIHDHFEAINNELIQSGTIVAMAESQSPLTSVWNSTSGLSWPGKDPNLPTDFGFILSSSDYGKTIGWHIKEGRDFSVELASDSAALILNEAAVSFMNLKDPVGQTLTWFGTPYTVIGIIDDMVVESPYHQVRPLIYGNLSSQGNRVLIKINPTQSAQSALTKIEEVFKRMNPAHPFEYRFVDDEYAGKFGDEQRIGTLVTTFTLLAIFISCLGLFGLASFVAEQRTKEIGVRKVLGASILSLWSMLSKDFLLLIFIAFLLSIPLGYYFMDSWLMKYQYHTTITWWVFGLSGACALLITLITISYQSIKAALSNPVKSLRTE